MGNRRRADGLTIVGHGRNLDFTDSEAFRWTEATGMVGLGHGEPTAVSADGSIVVERLHVLPATLPEQGRFIWDITHGTRLLQDVLNQRLWPRDGTRLGGN